MTFYNQYGPSPWTESRTDLLREQWAAGFTSSQIARLLGGVSRSAVLGKVFRLGLSGTQQRPARQSLNPNRVKGAAIAARVDKKPAPMKPEPVEPLNVPFLERAPFTCRAITDPTRYAQRVCGHPAPDGVYCAHHRAIYSHPHKSKERAA